MPTLDCFFSQNCRFVVFLLLLATVFCGCTDQQVASLPSGNNSVVKVGVDEILARTDVPEKARKRFEALKAVGQTMFLPREVDLIVTTAAKRESVLMEAATRHNREPIRQPSLSVLREPIEFSYPSEPINALDLINGLGDYMRIGVEHFSKKGIFRLSDADRKAAIKFMNGVCDQPKVEFDEKIWQEILAEGEALHKKFPTHIKTEPMFSLCLAIAESRGKKLAEASLRLEEVIEKFASDDYPTRMAILAFRFRDSIRSGHSSRTSYPMRVAAMKHWVTRDFRARGLEERYTMKDVDIFFTLAFLNRDWPALTEFTTAVQESKSLPPWFQSMVLGKYELKVAYRHRGSGMADTVSEEGWEKFEFHCKAAHKHFEAALEANPLFPEAATELLGISRTGHSEQSEEFWFEKAIEHEFDFMLAYRKRLVGLMPRWGGSVKEMKKFALEQARKEQYESGVPYVLPAFILMTRNFGTLDKEAYAKLFEDKELLDETNKAIAGMVEQNTQHVFDSKLRDRKYLLTLQALFLCRSGHLERAERTLEKLKGQNSAAAMKTFGANAGSLETILADTIALNAEYQGEAKKLRCLIDVPLEKRIENLGEITTLVEEVVDADASGKLFFQRALQRVKLEAKYAQGEPVKLSFDKPMNAWQMKDNRQLTFVSENTALFDNRIGDYSNQAFHVSSFPGPRVVEATFTFPSNTKSAFDFAPGILIGGGFGSPYTVGVEHSDELANQFSAEGVRHGYFHYGISQGDSPRLYRSFAFRGNRCHLKVYTSKHYIEAYVNGQFVCRIRARFLAQLTTGLALQQNRGRKGRGAVEVSDIVVQKWEGPPPLNKSAQEMAKYYEKRLKRNPDSPWDLFWLGHAWHSMREFDKALPLYLKACEHGVSKHYAGFFIGDVYDFQGKRREALDWYLDAALNSDGGGPRNAMFVGSKIGNISEPINWAAFRAKWLLATTELEANRKEKILARAKVRHELYWLSQLGALVSREKPKDEKSHERRLENMKYIQRRADGQFEEVISEVTKAIKQDGTYKVSSEKQPLYLKVQPFFLFFDSKATWSRQE